jgi:hypothetical protein
MPDFGVDFGGFQLPDIFSGARRFGTDDYNRKLGKIQEFARVFRTGNAAAVNSFLAKHKTLAKEIRAGKWNTELRSLGVGDFGKVAAAPGMPKPTRFGDLPLRAGRDAVLPAIGGPMRKIAVGALGRMAGPAGVLITAGSLIPKEWIDVAARNARFIPGPVGNMARVLPVLAGQIVASSMPSSPRPEIKPVRVTAKRMIAPVVVTAKRISRPTGVVVTGGSAAAPGTPWWQQVLQPLMALALKPRTPSGAPRISIVNSPFTDSPEQPDTGELPIGGPLTPLEPGSADCACSPKPRKPRQPRSKCRTGRFIERLSGIQKYQTRSVQCRPSRKKLR